MALTSNQLAVDLISFKQSSKLVLFILIEGDEVPTDYLFNLLAQLPVPASKYMVIRLPLYSEIREDFDAIYPIKKTPSLYVLDKSGAVLGIFIRPNIQYFNDAVTKYFESLEIISNSTDSDIKSTENNIGHVEDEDVSQKSSAHILENVNNDDKPEKSSDNVLENVASLHTKHTNIQFRFHDGSFLAHKFPSTATLQNVAAFLEISGYGSNLTIMSVYPHRRFHVEEYQQSLDELGLVPTACLHILPRPESDLVAAANPLVVQFLELLAAPFIVAYNTALMVFRYFFPNNN